MRNRASGKKIYMAAAAAFVIGMAVRPLETGATADGGVEGTGHAIAGVAQLQIPEKLNVVLDPWEMDGREQVYSETYEIQNTGDTAGTLTLSFVCGTAEGSGVVFRSGPEGLRDGEEKAIYIEVALGEGDRLVLSQENAEYRTELEPGESLSVRFTGEMNENASEPWGNGDVSIEGVYAWETTEAAEPAEQTAADTGETVADLEEAEGSEALPEEKTEETELPSTVSGNDLPEQGSVE